MSYTINILDSYNIPYIIIKKTYKRVTVKYNSNAVLEIRQPINFPDVKMIEFIEKPELIEIMGKKSFEYCKNKIDVIKVNEDMCRYLNIRGS